MRIRMATQSYRHDALEVSAQSCVNFFAERQPPDAKTDVAVFGCPGIENFVTCGTGPIRGGHTMGGVPYVVSGAYLYRFDDDRNVTQLGGQISGNGIVSMDDNGEQLAITNGENGYIYSSDTGFQLISDTDFSPANTVSTIDSFFAFDKVDTNEFQLSDLLDGTAYSDIFGSAETKSDNILAVLNHLQVLHLFGEKTTELWQNVGAANMPLQRIPGGMIARGIAGPHAKAVEDSAIFMMGDDRIAYRLNGTAPVKISTPAIDSEWQRYRTMSDCSAFAYTYSGHKFVNFNFPTANTTFVYDISTGLWHERSSIDMNGNNLGCWRGNCAFEAFGKTFIGDKFSGRVGPLNADTYTEFGNKIRGELVSPPVHGDGKRVFVPYFEIDVATGVGLTSGQGENPQYMLDISTDNGKTWDLPQVWSSAGKKGEKGTPLRWDRLGSDFQYLFRVTIDDPVKRVVYAARCPGLRIGI